ncbi:DUF4358 domain-containing protein [Bacillus sp. FJAT-29937]|uniref:DUF4358 domain-containing protein n=1 Tax=Bacillus sp. FJAT-29937 TaxID=1720553 RepID=UPI0008307E23|nr:DUF4358 domain-containing protein [Bacillus sp. FJAT-29937]
MKKGMMWALFAVFLLTLTACSNNRETKIEPKVTVKEMAEQLLIQVEQPAFMELEEVQVKESYYINPNLLEEYIIQMPLMNVTSNELSILKLKDKKDLETVKSALEKRAADAIRNFENYLPDQYENAKNYKIVTNGNYMLFVISEESEELIKHFNAFFSNK